MSTEPTTLVPQTPTTTPAPEARAGSSSAVSHTPPQSFARSILLSAPLKRLKRAFKKLFQLAFDAHFEEQFSKKQISVKPGFTDEVAIPLSHFNEQIKNYIKERKDNNLPCEFYVIKNEAGQREVVRIISQPYFFQDPATEVTWGGFKDFFYSYDQRYKLEVKALKNEIVIYESLHKIFKKYSKSPLTYEALQKIIAKAHLFSEENPFWKLECWQPDYAQQAVTESRFSEKYLPGKSVENLKQILEQLQSGLQPEFGESKSLSEVLTFSNDEILTTLPTSELLKLPGMDTTISSNDVDLFASPEEQSASSSSSSVPLISSGHVSFHLPEKQEETEGDKKEGSEETGKQRQAEKNVVVDLLQTVSERREWSARVQNILDSANSQLLRQDANAHACQLLADAYVLVAVGFDHEEDSLKIQLEEVEKKHLPKKGLFGKKPISDEQYLTEKTAIEQSLVALGEEQELVGNLFGKAIHQQVQRATCATACTLPLGIIKPESKRSCKLETSIFSDSSKTPAVFPDVLPPELLPGSIDYSSQLHAVEDQVQLQVTGAAVAVKTVQEWQDWNRLRSFTRLSAPCLERSATQGSVDALTQALKTKGVGSIYDYQEFLESQTTHKVRSRAILQSRSSLHMTDEIYLAPDLASLKSALVLEGPVLLTLPVFDPTLASSFWIRPVIPSDPLGYQTVMVVGYNDETGTIKIRNSLGQSWGAFGSTEISYSDVFTAPNTVFVLTGPNSCDESKNQRRAGRMVKVNVAKRVTTSKDLFPQDELDKVKAKAQYYKRQWQAALEQLKTHIHT